MLRVCLLRFGSMTTGQMVAEGPDSSVFNIPNLKYCFSAKLVHPFLTKEKVLGLSPIVDLVSA